MLLNPATVYRQGSFTASGRCLQMSKVRDPMAPYLDASRCRQHSHRVFLYSQVRKLSLKWIRGLLATLGVTSKPEQ